jgi:hypothetical protein
MPGNEAPPSSGQVKIAWSYTSIPTYIFVTGCLIKRGDKFLVTKHVNMS